MMIDDVSCVADEHSQPFRFGGQRGSGELERGGGERNEKEKYVDELSRIE